MHDEIGKEANDGTNLNNYDNKTSLKTYDEEYKFRLNPSAEEPVKPKVSRLQHVDNEFNSLISRVYK